MADACTNTIAHLDSKIRGILTELHSDGFKQLDDLALKFARISGANNSGIEDPLAAVSVSHSIPFRSLTY